MFIKISSASMPAILRLSYSSEDRSVLWTLVYSLPKFLYTKLQGLEEVGGSNLCPCCTVEPRIVQEHVGTERNGWRQPYRHAEFFCVSQGM